MQDFLHMQTLLGGFISVLTPGVFLMTLISIITFSKMDLKKGSRIFSISIFCSLIIICYVIIGVFLINTTSIDLTSFSSNLSVKYLFVILNISVGLWLLGLFKAFPNNIESNWLFKSSVIVIMSIVFTASSFSGTGPIIGTILITNSEVTTILATVTPLLTFAIGLTIPIGLIVFLMSKLISKKKEKKWFIIVQSITGAVLITLTIIGGFVR